MSGINIPQEMGKVTTDLVAILKYTEIDQHAHQVIKTLTSVRTEILTKNGHRFNVSIMPYRTLNDRIDELVMTFDDITVSEKLEQYL
ncbi:MAG TPA: PAS domain-containing protein [Prolixibacteraceae bacterium]|nr:PAS domain-containing protein [Prolixibacteraceae bacterium]